MASIDVQATVGQLVRETPSRARVFESLQIDYCCGGKVSLADACAKKHVDPNDVLKQLVECDRANGVELLVDANAMSMTELADHIEQTHHEYLRRELPRLDAMTEKVARVHGEKEPRLQTLRAAFVALKDELEPHIAKEETILFPMIRQLDAASNVREFHCGSISNPIQQMEHEHDDAGDALAVIREATDAYEPPKWACNTYRAMLDSLKQLEANMHQHVHKENNVLFAKALELEGATT